MTNDISSGSPKNKTFNPTTDIMIGLTFALSKPTKASAKEMIGTIKIQIDHAYKAKKLDILDGNSTPLGPVTVVIDALPDQGNTTLVYAFRLSPATAEFANKALKVINEVLEEVCNNAEIKRKGITYKSALFVRRKSAPPHAGDVVPDEHFKMKEGDRWRWTNPEMQEKHPDPVVIGILNDQAICKDKNGVEFLCSR